jgi:hypothetical protein
VAQGTEGHSRVSDTGVRERCHVVASILLNLEQVLANCGHSPFAAITALQPVFAGLYISAPPCGTIWRNH